MTEHKDKLKIVNDTPAWMLRAEHVGVMLNIRELLLSSQRVGIMTEELIQMAIDMINDDKYVKDASK